MDLEQRVTLTLTEAECADYCTELHEALGLLEAGPDGGSTRTGLIVMRKLRDLMHSHGLSGRTAFLEADVRYLTGRVKELKRGIPMPPPMPPAVNPPANLPFPPFAPS